MFYIKWLTIHKVKMHTGAIGKLLHFVCVCTGDNNSLKLVGYLPVPTHKTYNNFNFLFIHSFTCYLIFGMYTRCAYCILSFNVRFYRVCMLCIPQISHIVNFTLKIWYQFLTARENWYQYVTCLYQYLTLCEKYA